MRQTFRDGLKWRDYQAVTLHVYSRLRGGLIRDRGYKPNSTPISNPENRFEKTNHNNHFC